MKTEQFLYEKPHYFRQLFYLMAVENLLEKTGKKSIRDLLLAYKIPFYNLDNILHQAVRMPREYCPEEFLASYDDCLQCIEDYKTDRNNIYYANNMWDDLIGDIDGFLKDPS